MFEIERQHFSSFHFLFLLKTQDCMTLLIFQRKNEFNCFIYILHYISCKLKILETFDYCFYKLNTQLWSLKTKKHIFPQAKEKKKYTRKHKFDFLKKTSNQASDINSFLFISPNHELHVLKPKILEKNMHGIFCKINEIKTNNKSF